MISLDSLFWLSWHKCKSWNEWHCNHFLFQQQVEFVVSYQTLYKSFWFLCRSSNSSFNWVTEQNWDQTFKKVLNATIKINSIRSHELHRCTLMNTEHHTSYHATRESSKLSLSWKFLQVSYHLISTNHSSFVCQLLSSCWRLCKLNSYHEYAFTFFSLI